MAYTPTAGYSVALLSVQVNPLEFQQYIVRTRHV